MRPTNRDKNQTVRKIDRNKKRVEDKARHVIEPLMCVYVCVYVCVPCVSVIPCQ